MAASGPRLSRLGTNLGPFWVNLGPSTVIWEEERSIFSRKNIFPFEYLTKSEMIAMIHQSDKKLLDMVWSCTGQSGTGRYIIKDNKPC